MVFGRNRIRVEIIGGAYPLKKNCELEGSKVIIDPGSKGRNGAAYTAEYDNTCLVPYYSGIPPFRQIKYKLMLRFGATKCVSFGGQAQDQAPSISIPDISKYGRASVIKWAGNLKAENKTFIYILLFALIILNILTLLAATGHVKL